MVAGIRRGAGDGPQVVLVGREQPRDGVEGLEQQGFVGPIDETLNPATGDDNIDPDADEDVDTTNENEGN